MRVSDSMVIAYQNATLGMSTVSTQTIRKGLEAALATAPVPTHDGSGAVTDEMVEFAARNIIRSDGGKWVDMDEEWRADVRRYHEMCAKFPDYAKGGSLLTDAFRRARAALTAAYGTAPTSEIAIRKAGQVAVDELIDRMDGKHPGDNDLADYMTRIVDACVRAALTAAHPLVTAQPDARLKGLEEAMVTELRERLGKLARYDRGFSWERRNKYTGSERMECDGELATFVKWVLDNAATLATASSREGEDA